MDNFWDIWEDLVLKQSLNIFLSVPYIFCPSFLGKIVPFFQFLQAESHSTNISGLGALINRFGRENVSELMQLKENMSSIYKNLIEK